MLVALCFVTTSNCGSSGWKSVDLWSLNLFSAVSETAVSGRHLVPLFCWVTLRYKSNSLLHTTSDNFTVYVIVKMLVGKRTSATCHRHVLPTVEISKRGCGGGGGRMFETQKRIRKPVHCYCYIHSQALDSFFFLDGLISKGKRAGGVSGWVCLYHLPVTSVSVGPSLTLNCDA
jgi:hypothetical protein